MSLSIRTRPAGRFGRPALDPSRPLYVCRRIGRGAAGALVPGQPFDATGVPPHRLRNLYHAGYIAHELPKTLARAVAAALARGTGPAPAVALEQPAASIEPPPAAKKRARAGA